MDLSIIFSGAIAFLKLLIVFSIAFFVLYKVFSPVKNWLMEKHSLSWIKACFVLNFAVIFLFLLASFIFFAYLASPNPTLVDPELQATLYDQLGVTFVAAIRITIASIILALFLLFFELIASLFMENKGGSGERKEKRRARTPSSYGLLHQFIGIIVSCAVFLVLVLFIFDWAPFGLFLFIFYGSVNPLPMVILP
jgi:hypothetical protein